MPDDDIFARHELRRVINCSGTETPFGGSPVRPEVIEAVADLVPHSVFMSELQLTASRVIARVSGSEAGCVTGCTAASITVAVAATMTGADLALVEQLPDTSGMGRQVRLKAEIDVRSLNEFPPRPAPRRAPSVRAWQPAIRPSCYGLIMPREGELLLSVAKIDDETAAFVCRRIEQVMRGDAAGFEANAQTYADQMQQQLLDWTSRL